MRGVASDEIGKISWVQIVKDLINHMNKFELYPSGKEQTMEVLKQENNIMTFVRKKLLAAEHVRDWGAENWRQGYQWETFAIILARKIQCGGNEWGRKYKN